MAVRDRRSARLRRAAGRRPLALVTLLYAAAAVVATWPAVGSFGSAFIANDQTGFGEPPAGDHLQSVYRFWLVGHQLEQADAPWKDPYSFQPLVEPQTVLGGWPFGFPFWPLEAMFGPVVAWNLLFLGTIVAAGLLTYGWLRALDLAVAPAAIGGLVFALAPYRLEQTAGHLLGWAALFLPLALLAIERARRAVGRRAHAWGALAAFATISTPLSGQVHLALGAIPFIVAYAALRSGKTPLLWTIGGALVAAGIGLTVRYALIAGSSEESGRSTDELRRYSAEPLDFLDRWHEPRSEEFVYLGWLTIALAVGGAVLLFRDRRRLAILLGLAAAVPVLFALGANLPGYEALWRHFPPLHFTRVPGRLLPVANLAIAALAAFACAALFERARLRAAIAIGAVGTLVALDLLVLPLSPAAADPGNRAYQALAAAPGRVLELPIFGPGQHYASVYDYYRLQEAREHPTGYSTLAPPEALAFYFAYNRLSCGVWLPEDEAALERLGITDFVYHGGLYAQAHRRGAWFAWKGLESAGFAAGPQDGAVTLFSPGSSTAEPPVPEPPRFQPVLCSGWRGQTTLTRQATIWVYGEGPIGLILRSPTTVTATLFADGRLADHRVFEGPGRASARLEGVRWHALLLFSSTAGIRLDELVF
jgi:hypothetical protein